MNFFRFITQVLVRDEPIAGLEISDSFVRLVLLEKIKNKKKKGVDDFEVQVRLSAEEPVKKGAIIGGKIEDAPLLAQSLKKLQLKARLSRANVIISIPPNLVYTKILTFPYSVEKD